MSPNVLPYRLRRVVHFEVVKRGAKKLGRADVLVELPATIEQSEPDVKEPTTPSWWSILPLYSTQYALLLRALGEMPGLKLIRIPDEIGLPIGEEHISCRTLGFLGDGYGTTLNLLPAKNDCRRLGLPRVLSLRVQGYGMTDEEKNLAADLKIDQCTWTQSGCDKALDRWERLLHECLALAYSWDNLRVFSSDGRLAWGILLTSEEEYSNGVLAALDTRAKGLKGFVKARNFEAKWAHQESSGRFYLDDLGEKSNQRTNTFIVVECKGPDVNYTESVLMQGLTYAKNRNATFLVLTNGFWNKCFCSSPDGTWVQVEDIPKYEEAISRKIVLTSAEPEEPHLPLPAHVNNQVVFFHERSRHTLGCDTSPDTWALLLRLDDFLLTSLNGTFPFTAPGDLTFREDWGTHWHEVGNPSGRTWPGKYRTFLLEDPQWRTVHVWRFAFRKA